MLQQQRTVLDVPKADHLVVAHGQADVPQAGVPLQERKGFGGTRMRGLLRYAWRKQRAAQRATLNVPDLQTLCLAYQCMPLTRVSDDASATCNVWIKSFGGACALPAHFVVLCGCCVLQVQEASRRSQGGVQSQSAHLDLTAAGRGDQVGRAVHERCSQNVS